MTPKPTPAKRFTHIIEDQDGTEQYRKSFPTRPAAEKSNQELKAMRPDKETHTIEEDVLVCPNCGDPIIDAEFIDDEDIPDQPPGTHIRSDHRGTIAYYHVKDYDDLPPGVTTIDTDSDALPANEPDQ